MIAGLQVQGEPTQNGKVFYHPAVLTVNGTSKYRDTEITFKEISGFWGLPQNFVFVSGPREEGTTLGTRVVDSDGKPEESLRLHIGDVAKFTLNLNPKRGENANPGSFYHNIGSIGSPNGEAPIQRQQQEPPQSGGSWASEPTATGEPFVDKWDLKDIHIRKAQALNILTEVLTSGDKVNAPKIVLKMGFTDAAEAIDALAHGWNLLRRGLPVELPLAVSDMEEEVTELADDDLDEDVETLSWD